MWDRTLRDVLLVLPLLTHDNAEAAAPAFRQTHTDRVHLGREIAQEDVRSGMKVKSRSDQIHQGWRRLQLNAREISVAREIALLEMAPNAKPVAGGLKRKVNVRTGRSNL